MTDSTTTSRDHPGTAAGAASAGTGKDTTPPAPPVKAAAVPDAPSSPTKWRKSFRRAAEFAAIAAIRKVCAKDGDDHAEICAQAIKEGWDVKDAELAILRADRPKAPSAHMVDSPSLTSGVLEAACMLTAGLEGVEKLTTRRPSNRPASGSGGDRPAGVAAGGGVGKRLYAAATSAIAARSCGCLRPRTSGPGLLTVDIDGILSNMANKFLLPGFFSVEQHLAEHLLRPQRQRFQDGPQLPSDRHRSVPAGRLRRRDQERHAGQRDLHQQGRHLSA